MVLSYEVYFQQFKLCFRQFFISIASPFSALYVAPLCPTPVMSYEGRIDDQTKGSESPGLMIVS